MSQINFLSPRNLKVLSRSKGETDRLSITFCFEKTNMCSSERGNCTTSINPSFERSLELDIHVQVDVAKNYADHQRQQILSTYAKELKIIPLNTKNGYFLKDQNSLYEAKKMKKGR